MNDLWRWADPSGEQRNARLDELRAALAEGQIPPNTPVWKAGWKAWQPAHEVPELTSASLGAANGVVLNIPPPPLAMVAVQQEYEAKSSSIAPPMPGPPVVEEEPPPVPAWTPAPSKTPRGLTTQLGGSAFVLGTSASSPPRAPASAPTVGTSLPTAIGLPPPPMPTGISAHGAPAPTDPIVEDASVLQDGEPAGVSRSRFVALLLDDIAALRQGRSPKNKPLLAATAGGALLLFVLFIAGIVGVASGSSSQDAAKTAASGTASSKAAASAATATATAAPSAAPLAAATPAPAPAAKEAKSGPVLGDCKTAGDAKTIAPRVVIASGIEARATGNAIALGFAAAPRDAVAVTLDPSSLAPASTVHAKAIGGDARRVTPMMLGGKLTAAPDVDRKGDRLSSRRVVETSSPIDIGWADGGIAWAPHGKDSLAKLFAVEGDGAVEALRAVPLADKKGIALAFRRGGAIHVGAAKGEGVLEPVGSLSRIAGLGQVGAPAIAVSGDRVAVAWADRAGADDEWKVRLASMAVGDAAPDATTFTLPEGGLGGAAMSPNLAPLGGGRFLLAWAEGAVSSHQVRAITIGVDGSPSGAPLVLSGSGLNAGQPAAAVRADGRGLVAFVVAKGKSLEVHATPISCPPQ